MTQTPRMTELLNQGKIGTFPELKACPFCGSEPYLDCLTDEDEYFVRCPSCGVQQIARD